jgi:hypothetical protein
MRRLKTEWKSFITEFGWKAFLDALLGGFVFATLVFLPIFVILAELIIIFMYMKTVLFALLFLAGMGYTLLLNLLTLKALRMKKPDALSHPEWLLQVHAIFWMTLIYVAGIVFILFLIPILWV